MCARVHVCVYIVLVFLRKVFRQAFILVRQIKRLSDVQPVFLGLQVFVVRFVLILGLAVMRG